MDLMYGRQSAFKVSYDAQYTLNDLHKDINDYMETAGYELAIEALNTHLTGAALSLYHDEEVRGIDLRVRRLLGMTK